jgi:hypothetical protein
MGERRCLYGILIGLCFGLTSGWLLWSGHGPNIREWAESQRNADTVLVIVVGTEANVEAVHRSVSPGRIVAHSDSGLAVTPQRLIVESLESAGEILMMAGWSNRPLEIVDIKGRPREDNVVDEKQARNNSLMKKATLTQGEAYFLLNSM